MFILTALKRFLLLRSHEPLSIGDGVLYGRCRFVPAETISEGKYKLKRLADIVDPSQKEAKTYFVLAEDDKGRKHRFYLDPIRMAASLYHILGALSTGSKRYSVWRAVNSEDVFYFIKES